MNFAASSSFDTEHLLRNAWSHLHGVLSAQGLNAANMVQFLVEHRLALPLQPSVLNSGLPSAGLLTLAADLQKRQSPASLQPLQDVLRAFDAAEIRTLVLKGAVYGRAFYPSPDSRRSTDHDLLVAPGERLRAHAELLALGFRAKSAEVFHSICGQSSYARAGSNVDIDLHWEMGNNFALYGRFGFSELYAEAVRAELTSETARFTALRLGNVHCAIHCALHYCSDHPQQRSHLALLDWLLISQTLTAAEQSVLLQRAQHRGVLGLIERTNRQANAAFGVKLDCLDSVHASADDPLLLALEARFEGSQAWWPLRTPSSVAKKLHYLLRQLLPPASYMRARYGANTESRGERAGNYESRGERAGNYESLDSHPTAQPAHGNRARAKLAASNSLVWLHFRRWGRALLAKL